MAELIGLGFVVMVLAFWCGNMQRKLNKLDSYEYRRQLLSSTELKWRVREISKATSEDDYVDWYVYGEKWPYKFLKQNTVLRMLLDHLGLEVACTPADCALKAKED